MSFECLTFFFWEGGRQSTKSFKAFFRERYAECHVVAHLRKTFRTKIKTPGLRGRIALGVLAFKWGVHRYESGNLIGMRG